MGPVRLPALLVRGHAGPGKSVAKMFLRELTPRESPKGKRMAKLVSLSMLMLVASIHAFAPPAGKYAHQWKRNAAGLATGRQSPNKAVATGRSASSGSLLRMAKGNNEPPQNDADDGLMDKLLKPWAEEGSGTGKTPFERMGNYVFDLATLTVRAAACSIRTTHPMLFYVRRDDLCPVCNLWPCHGYQKSGNARHGTVCNL